MIYRLELPLLCGLLISGVAGKSLLVEECPILGPSFPTNFDLSEAKSIQEAKALFPKVIDKVFESGKVDAKAHHIAIDVFSTSTNASIYSYYHEAPGLNGTLPAGELNDQTVSRVGSVSKLVTAYAILAQAGIEVFDHPVTRYLPELAGNRENVTSDAIIWEDVTIGALASQQGGSGGVPLEYAPHCLTPQGCSAEDLLIEMKYNKRPVMPPFHNALYSDSGYAILGQVLERLTGLPYNDAIKKVLAEPLGLNSTTSKKPAGKKPNAIVLPGPAEKSSWGYDPQSVAGSGGVYTNGADYRALGLSILNSRLLSPATTRSWMKPQSGTSSLVFSIGAPWEIYRLLIPVSPRSNRTRVSDLYTKSGGVSGYTSILALSPDHGLGYSILIAGNNSGSARWPLRDIVGETFIPAAEHAGVENAKQNLVGTFANSKVEASNLTLAVEDDHTGLRLESWFVGGVSWLANVSEPAVDPSIAENLTILLYPTGSMSRTNSLSDLYITKGTVNLTFRAIPNTLDGNVRAEVEGGVGMFDNSILPWFGAGMLDTNDEFVLEITDGKVKSVVSPVNGLKYERLE